MINLKLKAVKGQFFDRPAVMNAVDRAERKAMSKAGAIVMREARQSIKPVSKGKLNKLKKAKASGDQVKIQQAIRSLVSQPGNPPFGHGEQLLRKNIYFAFEPTRHTVVVGPIKLNKPSMATESLEFGGSTKVEVGPKVKREVKTVTIAARPYMRPARERTDSKVAGLWKDAVK